LVRVAWSEYALCDRAPSLFTACPRLPSGTLTWRGRPDRGVPRDAAKVEQQRSAFGDRRMVDTGVGGEDHDEFGLLQRGLELDAAEPELRHVRDVRVVM